MPCQVGLIAHNEGRTIAAALRALLSQKGPHIGSLTITVVASGCTDDTVERARDAAGSDARVKLLEQPCREGKASAIRAFLDTVGDSDIAVLTGGDTCLEEDALEALVAPFEDTFVGMTGGHAIPVNSRATWMGRVVHLLWEMHHAVALQSPKLGELVAFRPFLPASLADTAVDEAAIEALIRDRGLKLVYVPAARVKMKGPETVADYLAQRRRIHAGHLRLRKTTGHAVSTMGARRILAAAWATRTAGPHWLSSLVAATILETTARLLGTWDEIAGHDHRIWKPISSTKDLSS